jgi:hypothetical protein
MPCLACSPHPQFEQELANASNNLGAAAAYDELLPLLRAPTTM